MVHSLDGLEFHADLSVVGSKTNWLVGRTSGPLATKADIDAACHARPHLVLDMGRLPEVGATLQWQSLGW